MIGFFSLILFFFGLAFFILFLYSLTKKRNSLSASFACMCLTISVYITGYAFELQANSIEQISFFLKAEYFGAPFMSGFWLLLTFKYLFKKPASLNTVILIMTVPFITLFLSVTNEYHHLIYTNISVFEHDGYLLTLLEKGPLYYMNILFAYSVQLFGLITFFRAWRATGYRLRVQSFWMFFGSIWPGLVNLIYVAGYSPLSLDLTPFGLSISAVFFYVAIFRYDFLELQEIVKDVTFLKIEEGILVVDEKNRLIDYNHACKEIFSWLEKNQIGIDITAFADGEKIIKQTASRFEMKIMNNGIEKYYEFRKTPLYDHHNSLGFIYFIQDISKQKEIIQALHDIASYDFLTEIYNRRRLMEELEKELLWLKRSGSCLSILMIDIDHFKLVNDQYGHQAGDQVLKALAGTCKDRIRRTDMIGRYGGEEFLVILPETNQENAFLVAENIRKCVADLDFHSNDDVIHITVSIGVKTVSGKEEDLGVEHLIKGADRALYQAKNNGRNRSIADYDPV